MTSEGNSCFGSYALLEDEMETEFLRSIRLGGEGWDLTVTFWRTPKVVTPMPAMRLRTFRTFDVESPPRANREEALIEQVTEPLG